MKQQQEALRQIWGKIGLNDARAASWHHNFFIFKLGCPSVLAHMLIMNLEHLDPEAVVCQLVLRTFYPFHTLDVYRAMLAHKLSQHGPVCVYTELPGLSHWHTWASTEQLSPAVLWVKSTLEKTELTHCRTPSFYLFICNTSSIGKNWLSTFFFRLNSWPTLWCGFFSPYLNQSWATPHCGFARGTE